MRNYKDITITDNGNEYKYRITKLSAISLQKWGLKALSILAETGLLSANISDLTGGMAELGQALTRDNFAFLGKLDSEKANAVIFELVEKTAMRLNGKAQLKVTEQELDNTLEEISSLFELEKECLLINFPTFAQESASDTPPSPQMEQHTSHRGISVQS